MKLYCKVDKEGNISKEQVLDNILTNVINPHKLLQSELEAEGIYRYVAPKVNSVLQELGSLYYDENRGVVTRQVIDKTIDIEQEKEKKINQVKDYINRLLHKTDFFFIRKMERNKGVPKDIEDERNFIHSEYDRMINEINNATDVGTVIKYNYKLTGLNYH